MSRSGSFDERSPESKQRSKIDEWKKKVQILKDEIEKDQREKDVNVTQFLEMSQKADPDQISILKNIFEKRNFTHGVKIQKAQAQLEKYKRKIEEAESTVGRSSFYSASSSFDSPSLKTELENVENQKRFKPSRSNENILEISNGGGERVTGSASGVIGRVVEMGGGVVGGDGISGGGGEGGEGGGGSNSSSLKRGAKLEDSLEFMSPRLHNGGSLPHYISFGDKSSNSNNNHTTTTNKNNSTSTNSTGDLYHSIASTSTTTTAPSSLELVLMRLTQELASTKEQQKKQLQELLEDQLNVKNSLEGVRQYYKEQMRNIDGRYRQLEDQLNDEVDAHHSEMANLKQEIGVLAAKEDVQIVDFRSKERSRDLHELLEACQQKVEKMEKSQEPRTHPEDYQRILLTKIVNFFLCLIQCGILLLNFASSIITSRSRLLFTSVVVILLALYRMQLQQHV